MNGGIQQIVNLIMLFVTAGMGFIDGAISSTRQSLLPSLRNLSIRYGSMANMTGMLALVVTLAGIADDPNLSDNQKLGQMIVNIVVYTITRMIMNSLVGGYFIFSISPFAVVGAILAFAIAVAGAAFINIYLSLNILSNKLKHRMILHA